MYIHLGSNTLSVICNIRLNKTITSVLCHKIHTCYFVRLVWWKLWHYFINIDIEPQLQANWMWLRIHPLKNKLIISPLLWELVNPYDLHTSHLSYIPTKTRSGLHTKIPTLPIFCSMISLQVSFPLTNTSVWSILVKPLTIVSIHLGSILEAKQVKTITTVTSTYRVILQLRLYIE